jgi:hypothetical protein
MRRTPESTLSALQTALAAEHAAIYGYGVLGARLRGTAQQSARDIWSAHHAKRDKLIAFLAALGVDPVPAMAAYKLPMQVTSAKTATQVAAVLEDRVLAAYLGLSAADDPKLRKFGAQAMQDAMTRGVHWRGTAPATAFPGLAPTSLAPRSEQ